MNENEIAKVGSSAIQEVFKNEKILSSIGEAINENKKVMVLGGLVLGGLWIFKDRKFNFKFKEDKDGNREIEFGAE